MRFAIPPSSKVRAIALPSYSAGLSRRPSRRRLLGANAPLGPRLRGDIRCGRTHPDRSFPGSLRRAGPTYSSPSTPVSRHDSTGGPRRGRNSQPNHVEQTIMWPCATTPRQISAKRSPKRTLILQNPRIRISECTFWGTFCPNIPAFGELRRRPRPRFALPRAQGPPRTALDRESSDR